jgi:molybdopterin synthase sulfur carrier subunit
MRVLYFAWVREKAGRDGDDVTLPATVTTVAELIEWLSARSPSTARALSPVDAVRVAVNRTVVDLDHPVAADDEVAFFPPVTGG